MREGDLLFFDEEGKEEVTCRHVSRQGRFIHAPSSGGKVRIDSTNAEYWKKHFVEARRVLNTFKILYISPRRHEGHEGTRRKE